jgi:hypothetical protein
VNSLSLSLSSVLPAYFDVHKPPTTERPEHA